MKKYGNESREKEKMRTQKGATTARQKTEKGGARDYLKTRKKPDMPATPYQERPHFPRRRRRNSLGYGRRMSGDKHEVYHIGNGYGLEEISARPRSKNPGSVARGGCQCPDYTMAGKHGKKKAKERKKIARH